MQQQHHHQRCRSLKSELIMITDDSLEGGWTTPKAWRPQFKLQFSTNIRIITQSFSGNIGPGRSISTMATKHRLRYRGCKVMLRQRLCNVQMLDITQHLQIHHSMIVTITRVQTDWWTTNIAIWKAINPVDTHQASDSCMNVRVHVICKCNAPK